MTTSNSNRWQVRKAPHLGRRKRTQPRWAIAEQLHAQGAELAFNYLGEALERRAAPLAEKRRREDHRTLHVGDDAQIDALFEKVKTHWAKLDILVHSVASRTREDLDRRFVETSREGFRVALDISAYSLVACARRAEPLMAEGGSIVTCLITAPEKGCSELQRLGSPKLRSKRVFVPRLTTWVPRKSA